MATLIGVVSQVIGEVFAVAGNGARRALTEGDRVFAGEQLVTGASGAVAIALVGGGELTLGRDSSLMLDTQLLAGARGDGSAAAAQGADSAPSDQDLAEVEQLQAAIEAGEDPTASLAATAAGPGAGAAGNAGGGHSFVLLDETAGAIDPVIGFPTEGLSFVPEFPDPDIEAADIAPSTPQIILGERQTVFESALATGSNADSDGEFVSGTFTLAHPDGTSVLQSLTINGMTVPIVSLVGASFVGEHGTLTITGYDSATGVVSYSFELTSPAGSGNQTGVFALSASDGTLSSAPANLIIEIFDDVPNAVDDGNSIGEDAVAPITGSVLDNDLHANGQPGADAPNSFVSWSSTAASFGTFTDTGNGTYSFLLDNSNPLVQGLGEGETLTETFSYTMRDADGDTDTATLSITITGSNDIPGISVDPGNEGGNDQVFEAGLASGSNAAGNSEFASGTFSLSDADGLDDLQSVTINGTTVAIGSLAGSSFAGASGTLTITAYDSATGVASYTYELTSPTTDGLGIESDSFSLSVFDGTASSAPASLVVEIVDDLPNAVNDTDSIAAGGFGPATGNVITDAAAGDAGDSDAGADTKGADGAVVSSVTATTAGGAATAVAGATLVQGAYGVLTLNPDGSYSYVRDAGTPGGVSDVFTYTLQDGDGDTDTATLTIAIGNMPPVILDLTPAANGGDVTVDEDDLADGSDTSKESLTQAGSFTISSPDGIASLTIGGETFITDGVFTAGSFTTALGNTLSITAYNADTGVVSYSYTLADNETHANAAGENSLFEDFAVLLTDQDGQSDSDTLSVNIVDDVPDAVNDTDSIAAGGFGPATGNVITDAAAGDAGDSDAGADTMGADGAAVFSVASNNVPANVDTTADGSGNFVLSGQYGVLTLNTDGGYSYVRNAGTPGGVSDVFTYTLRDGDGDTDTATLTIAIGNTPPVITGLTPSANGGDVTVDEDDLADGSDSSKESLTQFGNFTITSPDGVASLTIGGETFISNGVFTAGSFTTALGNTLNVTAYNPATGVVSYSYTLADNETHANAAGENSLFEDFAVLLTDQDGQSDSDTLSVNIVDDVPDAVNDTDSIAAGGFGPATGNVITDAAAGDAGDSDAGADTKGADGAVVSSVTATTAGGAATAVSGATVVQGEYGVLTLNPDGSYSYVRDAGTPGGVSDVFTYTLQDGDGDTDTATLTITIDSTPPVITGLTPAANGGDVTVDEDDLADGSDSSKESLTQSGSFTITSPDGIASLTIGGETFITDGVFTAGSFMTALGNTLTVTAYDADTGVVSYSYTLADNETHANAAGENSLFEDFAVVLTDQDGQFDSDTLSVNIIDDVPDAVNDTDSIAAGGFGPATGNVITDAAAGDAGDSDAGADTKGADGAVVSSVTATTAGGAATAVSGATVVQGEYGVLTLNPDGSYSYVRDAGTPGGVSDVFTYTLQDGDGDTDTATLTIAIGNTPPVITGLTPAANGGDVTVDEDDLADGSDSSKESLTQSGSFTITSPDGIASLTIGGETFITDGVFTAGSFMTALGNTLTVTAYDADTGVVSYSYTLADNETHANAAGENSLFEDFAVVLTDQDGQFDSDTLSVNIIDDVPDAVNDTDSIAAGGFGPATGNVITDAAAGDAGDSDAGADTKGADGAVVSSVTATTAGGAATVVSGATVVQGEYGVLTLNPDGSYSYVRDAGTPGGVSDVFTYTLQDGDGDTDTATLTIAIGNTPPVITGLTPSANGGDVTVDEDDLADGSDSSKESLTQFGNFTITSPDGVASLTIGGETFISNGVFTAGSFMTALGNTLTVTAYDADTGVVSYSYTLADNETHLNADGQNSLFENFAVVLTDQDGQFDSDTLSVNIVDDVPLAFDPARALLVDQVPTSHTVIAGLNFADAAGADGVGTVVFSNFTQGDIATDADGQPLFFNGEQLYLYYGTDQTQLVAKTADNDIGYTIDIDPASDTYTVTTHGVISNGAIEVTTTDLSGVGAGNVNFKGLVDIGGTTQDALISSTSGSINSDLDDIGIANQWISTAENVRFDFVNGLAADGANGTGFVYTDHNLVFGFRQRVYVQGGPGNTANLIVMALVADNDYVFGSGDAGETQVDLSIGDIRVFDGAVDVTGLVTLVDNGTSITIEGMHNGWTFQIVSDTAFSAVYVEGAADTDEFSLGFFTYTQTVPGQPIDLSHAITATDGDGDAVSSTINATLYPASTSVEGDSGDNVINGTAGLDHLFGYEGNDTLSGLLGDDVLSGGDGDDILVGGLGNDLMSGGTGADIFRWQAGESGTDTITDFVAGFNSGGGQLDLSELLVGEHGTPEDLGNLLSYIDIAISGLDTVLNVSSTAVADPAAAPEQTIVLQNVNLYASYGVGNEADLMMSMLGDGTLKVDTV